MELVSVLLSRLFWLYKYDEVRPVGGVYLPSIVEHVSNIFNFVKQPTPDNWGQGLTFGHGRYTSERDSHEIVISSLSIQNTVVMIDVESNTDDGEEVLNTLVSALMSKGFRNPMSATTLLFNTAVIVDLTKSIDGLISDYGLIAPIISQRFPYEGQAHVHSIEFRLDPAALPSELAAQNPTGFRMELRSGATYAQKRYYVEANLRTKDLLPLLEELEGRL